MNKEEKAQKLKEIGNIYLFLGQDSIGLNLQDSVDNGLTVYKLRQHLCCVRIFFFRV